MRRFGRVVSAALVAVAYGLGVLMVVSVALVELLDRGGAMLPVAVGVVVAVPAGVLAYRTGPGRALLAVLLGMLVPLLAVFVLSLAGGPLVWVPLSWPVWAAVGWWLLARRRRGVAPVPVLMLALVLASHR